jgi:sulfur carrier protein ThiS
MAMISAKITYEGRTKTLKIKGRFVEDAIKQFGISPQTVLVKVNGEFVPDDQTLKSGDKVELIRISSIG